MCKYVNCDFPQMLLDKINHLNYIGSFFYFNSFFSNKSNFNKRKSRRNYCITKRSFSKKCQNKKFKFKFFDLSLHHIYGPFTDSMKIIDRFLKKLFLKKSFTIYVPNEKRDFIHIDLIYEMLEFLIASKKTNKANYIDLGTGCSQYFVTFLTKFINAYNKKNNTKKKINIINNFYEKKFSYIDPKYDVKNFGFKPNHQETYFIKNTLENINEKKL